MGLSKVRLLRPDLAEEIFGEVSRKTKLDRKREGRGERMEAKEAFDSKRKAGMSDREVGWIIRDFLTLGLDGGEGGTSTTEEYLALRRKRGEWFLKAIEDAFSLSKEQMEEARISIREMEDRDFVKLSEYLKDKKPFVHEGRQYMIISGHELNKFTDPEMWLEEDGYQPWNLCGMSAEQEELTWKAQVEPEVGDALITGESLNVLWKDVGGETGFFPVTERRNDFLRMGRWIPYGPGQDVFYEKSEYDFLQKLHPGQLMVGLLLKPGEAVKIADFLEEKGD